MERRNNERIKVEFFFYTWGLKTQLILIEKFSKESHYRQQHYMSDCSGTWVRTMFVWRPYLRKVLVLITVITPFFSRVSTFFCMYILVCTCLYNTYLCVYLHMLAHVQLCAHTIARVYHQVPSSFALCLIYWDRFFRGTNSAGWTGQQAEGILSSSAFV